MTPSRDSKNRRLHLAVLLGSAIVFLLIAFVRAWVHEDTYITYRTIDNFVNGYGLRWNIDERVQTYTHPLWMLINIPFYFVTREICTTVTMISLFFSTAAYLVIGSRFHRDPFVLLVGFFLPLILSGSFMLYTTSGFENPLSCFLFALFARLLLDMDKNNEVPWGRLALVAALASMNRLDTTLLYIPPLAFLLLARMRQVRWTRFFLGLSPILLWLTFSLFYYGFPFPNTGLAKLDPGIPTSQYWQHGIAYIADIVLNDPITFQVLLAGVVITLFALWSALSRRGKQASNMAGLGSGMLLYCAYVVAIGGCYLSGRFWSVPMFAAVLLFAIFLEGAKETVLAYPGLRKVASFLIIVFFAMVPTMTAWIMKGNGVFTGSIVRPLCYTYLAEDFTWKMTRGARDLLRIGWIERDKVRDSEERHICVKGAVGLAGFTAGPDVVFIDFRALTDPFLARLHSKKTVIKTIGHLPRLVPEGYIEARRTGSLEKMDPHLREYYRPLRLIINGPLFSAERLKTVMAFNLGEYNHFRETYYRKSPALRTE